MNDLLTQRPGIVRQVDSLAELAATINAEHAAGENAARKGLECFPRAGVALIKAKATCGHGKWLPWLKANAKFSYRTASKYMLVADKWDKLDAASNLKDALRLLADDAPEQQEPPPAFEAADLDDARPAPAEPPQAATPLARSKPSEPPAPRPSTNGTAKATPGQPKPPCDGLGITLKPEFWGHFDILETFDRAERMGADLAKLIGHIAEATGGEMLRQNCKLTHRDGKDHFSLIDLTNAIRTLRHYRPYASVCPYCLTKNPGKRNPACNGCRGLPYVTQDVFERAPEEMKAAVRALVPGGQKQAA